MEKEEHCLPEGIGNRPAPQRCDIGAFRQPVGPAHRHLLDKYDVYQHLMNYWAEVMQDDSYIIADSGLYNNLGDDEDLALAVHEKIITYRPDNWKGNETKERVIKSRLYEVLGDEKEVERIFPVIKKQSEY